MEFDPPSAMTRFGMFVLAGGVAVIFAIWGVLHWIDKPRPPAPVRPAGTPAGQPSPTPSAAPSMASPAQSIIPPPATPA